MWFSTSSGRIELQITKTQARNGHHSGPCDNDVAALSNDPKIKKQLKRIDPDTLKAELSEYGAWDDVELEDHAQNLQRLLWLACGDITDRMCK